MKTFLIKGKITQYYIGSVIEADTELEAKEIYAESLENGLLQEEISADLDVWTEIETEVE